MTLAATASSACAGDDGLAGGFFLARSKAGEHIQHTLCLAEMDLDGRK
jgi:hypothetical protein